MSTLSNPIADLSPEQLAKLRYELKASKARKQEEIPRRVPGEPCPLSFAQQRLWFIAQLEPDNPFYNCLEILRLTGKLNLLVIEQTFSELVRRHEILRTTFDLVGGEPAQLVSSEFKLNLRVMDLQSLPESKREKQASRLSSATTIICACRSRIIATSSRCRNFAGAIHSRISTTRRRSIPGRKVFTP